MPGRFDTNQNAAREGVVPVSSLYTRVDGAGGVTHASENVKLLTQPHMSNFVPPKRFKDDREGKQLCSADGCRAYPMKDTGYCAGHTRSLGLKDWPKGGRPSEAD
jgi:hypothetical protein